MFSISFLISLTVHVQVVQVEDTVVPVEVDQVDETEPVEVTHVEVTSQVDVVDHELVVVPVEVIITVHEEVDQAVAPDEESSAKAADAKAIVAANVINAYFLLILFC